MSENILKISVDNYSRTLSRVCHNFKHVAIIEQMFNQSSGDWENILETTMPLNHLAMIYDFCHANDVLGQMNGRAPIVPENNCSEMWITPTKSLVISAKELERSSKRSFAEIDYGCVNLSENQMGEMIEIEEVLDWWGGPFTPPKQELLNKATTPPPRPTSQAARRYAVLSNDVTVDNHTPLPAEEATNSLLQDICFAPKKPKICRSLFEDSA